MRKEDAIKLSEDAVVDIAEALESGKSEQPPAAEFATLAHELAHELLHRGDDRANFSKVVKELEAEATAYVVVKAVCLEDGLRQSADYIQLYSGDKDRLLQSLERISSVAAQILVDLDYVELRKVASTTQS